ncbi:hypothetical protein YC2023_044699 [Brassica napus]
MKRCESLCLEAIRKREAKKEKEEAMRRSGRLTPYTPPSLEKSPFIPLFKYYLIFILYIKTEVMTSFHV